MKNTFTKAKLKPGSNEEVYLLYVELNIIFQYGLLQSQIIEHNNFDARISVGRIFSMCVKNKLLCTLRKVIGENAESVINLCSNI